MITVDLEAGMAREIGQFIEGAEDGMDVIVDVALHDEDELAFTWKDRNGTELELWLPSERIRKILAID